MKKYQLPPHSKMMKQNFIYGVATSSFQIEGAIDSRLPCIWDKFCATEGKIADNSNGSIACEHYSRWREDVELIASLGVDSYRFSISWPRVVNEDGGLNQIGIDFYIDLLDALNAKGIKPFVTLYHWDLPQHLEDKGGWLNRKTAFKFAEYAELVSTAFGNRVYAYATFNEPFCSAFLGYEIGVHAPGIKGKEYGRKAAHHILLAHGLGMKVLQKNAPHAQNGIVLNFTPCYPRTDCQADRKAANYADQYINQWYIKPLFDGCYPTMLAELPEEQRPNIVDGDFDIISQPLDFLGVNYYTRLTYSAPQQAGEFYFEHEYLPPKTDIGWEIYPEALTSLLVSLSERFNLPPIFITENGAATVDRMIENQIKDIDRITYYQSHLTAVHNAIEQGVDVQGYFAWSLMDNFEWAEGYSKRFGIVYVDYDSQSRTVKNSGIAYKALINSRV